MRVIRTEMYFDEVNGANRPPRSWRRADRGEKYNHGLAFAWFRSDALGPFDIKNEKVFSVREITADEVRPILDALLRDIDGRDLEFNDENRAETIQNLEIIDFVYEQTIIIEQSPPEGVRFKDLLKRTNAPIYVGTFMGAGVAMDHPALMFITIPLGIMVIGPAMGVSDAMAAGLNKRIKQMFERRKNK